MPMLASLVPRLLGSRPQGPERRSDAGRLDPMRRVEVMTILETLDREIRKDHSQAVGHPAVQIRVAATTEGKPDRAVEATQRRKIEIG
jgi:hypothetical protein